MPLAKGGDATIRSLPSAPLGALRLGWAVLALLLTLPARPQGAVAQPAERRPSPLSVNPPSDAAIKRRIEGILDALGGTEEVDVDVRNGIVRLGGRADSLALREQASDLAGRVDGVVLVRNDVEVAADVRGRLGPTWHKVKGYLKGALGFLPVLGVALLAFLAFAVLASLVGRWERPFRRLGLSVLGANVLRAALRATLLVAGIVLMLDLLGLAAFARTVVGALGVVGVVAGIALRDVIANYLPGVMLGLNPPFRPGDRVQIGEHVGRVVRVTSRETILVEQDGQHLRIPNVTLLQKPIVNFEHHRERRLAIDSDQVRVAFFAWADQRAANFQDLASGARQAVKEALLAARVPFPMHEVAVHQAGAGTWPGSLDEEAPDGPEEALLEDHLREEEAEPGERDLLREGRSPHP